MQSVQPLPVLVVEDDAAVRRTLERACRFSGRAVVAVDSGEAALDWLRDHAPSLVVLDFQLPGISGLEVLYALRGQLEVPVVLVTAGSDRTVRARAEACGARFVQKPFDLDTVLGMPAVTNVAYATD